jgi:hypothetical protein
MYLIYRLKSRIFTIFFLIMALCNIVASDVYAKKLPRPPQYVCISFDGSGSFNFWQQTLRFAEEFNKKFKKQAKTLHFTYFISGIHFMPTTHRALYQTYRYVKGRRQKVQGQAAIRFGGKPEWIKKRIEMMFQSIREGHEIGSHVVGHFDSKAWDAFQWDEEFRQFNAIMYPIFQLKQMPQPHRWDHGKLLASEMGIVGFRAPYLNTNQHLWPVMRKHGFRYDASGLRRKHLWPYKNKDGIWRFLLAPLTIVGSGKPTLSMDWNFFIADTNSKYDPSPQNRRRYTQQMLETYRRYFAHNYNGNRSPIHIGHHLVNINGNAYHYALQRFIHEVCHLPEVHCSIYKDLLKYVESLSPEILSAYQRGHFDQTNRPKYKSHIYRKK